MRSFMYSPPVSPGKLSFMPSAKPVPFMDLAWADLEVDRVYRGGRAGNIGDDPLRLLLPVGNAGGFRFAGSPSRGTVKLAVLFTSAVDPDWPDTLDVSAGTFTYYGDNKSSGRDLHDTPRKGNLFLRDLFAAAAAGSEGRKGIPPIFLFVRGVIGHDVQFRGLLVPGSPTGLRDEDLVAVWRTSNGDRFQNYRATFTVLRAGTSSRAWLDELRLGAPQTMAPQAWSKWVESGVADPLIAPPVQTFRTRDEQMPVDAESRRMLEMVRAHFELRPHDFEACAVELWMMIAPSTVEVEVTQRSRDGGRDAVGKYVIGPTTDPVRIDFALEAKCYASSNSVGVREMSRLISRLRHRNFGVLVTTSYVDRQAYREIRDDGHPIVVVSGRDVVNALRAAGVGNRRELASWLSAKFPSPTPVAMP